MIERVAVATNDARPRQLLVRMFQAAPVRVLILLIVVVLGLAPYSEIR